MTIDVFNCFPTSLDIYWKDMCMSLKKQILLLEKRIDRFKSEKEQVQEQCLCLQRQLTLLQKELECFQRKIEEEQFQKDHLEKELKEMSQFNQESLRKNSILAQEYQALNEKYQKLLEDVELEIQKQLQKAMQTLTLENQNLKEQLQEMEEKKDQEFDFTRKRESVKKMLLGWLLRGEMTLTSFQSYIASKGYFLEKEEIYQILQSLSQNYAISRRFTKDEIVFSIRKPVVETNQRISIPNNANSLEFFLYSDLHCHFNNMNAIFQAMDQVNDYCTLHGIHYAFHLGDFYSFPIHGNTVSLLNDFRKTEKQIKEMPVSSSIFYGFLGGNHDRDLLRLGIDTVADLEQMYPNFKSLGYSHCFLTFPEQKDMVAFHHPDVRLPLNSPSHNPWSYLNEYYASSSMNRARVVYDSFGHLHQYFSDPKFCVVPSLVRDRYQNGAVHVTLFFNSKGRITDIIIVPLELRKKLVPKGKEVYQKVRKRL